MLCIEALETALPLTDRLDRAGVIVRPVSGTPLDMVVQATRSSQQFAIPVEGSTTFQPNLYDIAFIANARDIATDTCAHDVALDHIVAMAAKAVQGHLAVIRNGVVPAILSLHDAVKRGMQDLQASSILGLEVKVWDLPLPMKNAALAGLISKFESTPLDSPALKMKCPDITMAELLDLMHTGAKGFDSDIDTWVLTKGDSFFLQLWEDIFTTKNDHFDRFIDAINCREQGLDRSLAIFLIARKLMDEPLAGTPMALPAFKMLAAEYRNQAAAKLARSLDEWSGLKKSKIMVKTIEDKAVLVNECVYRPWIASGGDVEVLLGSLVTNARYVTAKQLDDNAAELKRAWTRHVSLSGVIEKSNRFIQIKQMLLAEFRRSLNELKGDVDGPDVGADERDQVLKLFRAELDKAKESHCDDLYNLCLKLICRSRFVKVDAEDFLMDMQRIQKDNPACSPREAATVAAMEYIANWVGEQFQVAQVNR